ncbi:MAG: PAS domain-containing protein [Verrucomicrobiota bacterium]
MQHVNSRSNPPLVIEELEELLLRSEQRFKALSKATAQIVSMSNPDGEFLGKQEQWENFTGQKHSDSDGFGWARAFHPDDVDDTMRRWQVAFKSIRPVRGEHRLRRNDGVYRDFNFHATPILKADGSVQEWLWVHTDITDRKMADDQINNALRELNDLKAAIDEHAIVAITDPKGKINTSTKSFARSQNISAPSC